MEHSFYFLIVIVVRFIPGTVKAVDRFAFRALSPGLGPLHTKLWLVNTS